MSKRGFLALGAMGSSIASSLLNAGGDRPVMYPNCNNLTSRYPTGLVSNPGIYVIDAVALESHTDT